MNKPEQDEYAEYYEGYISQVNGDVLPILDAQGAELRAIFSGIQEEKGTFAYADGKWTLKEVLSHLIDAERVFAYRVLRISRGDKTPIEGFEQNDYIETSNANNRSFADLLEEFDLNRRSNMLMLKNIDDEGSRRMGTASDNPVSVRALAYDMAGHVIHHVNILKERYSV
jgi:hypothetical protein